MKNVDIAASLLPILAILSYLYASFSYLLRLKEGKQSFTKPTYIAICLALLSHGALSYQFVITPEGVNLSFFNVATLIFWIMSLLSLSAIMRGKEIENLALGLYPLAAISLACASWIPSGTASKTSWNEGLTIHIVSSIIAYGMLTIAALQAVSLAMQEYALKNRKLRELIRFLPPLQTMEELLFEMLWIGISLLSVSILSGYFFIEDLFAQHLAHKSVFTLSAWVIFSTLLWGRHQKGWRGQTAVKWTLAGFFILMLAYFGSKLVLEFILN